MEVIFATNNRSKVKEVQSLLPDHIRLITLAEAGVNIDLPEPYETLEENARSKIQAILKHTGRNIGFSEDSGLFIEALNGRPGVHSAHYAGPQRSDLDNIQRVLHEMKDQPNRSAFFQTTICLIQDNQENFFTGVCPGSIEHQPSGMGGFGYDPIFRPNGASSTFGEMSLEEKNRYSHRKKAVWQLIKFLGGSTKND